MQNKRDAVKKWRINTKIRFVESMGGCCQICDYNKCYMALELHHINPEEKEFSFGGVMSHPKAWKVLVTELRKCVLLCSNCHKEVHAGMTELPDVFERFNEDYVDYKEKAITYCPVCNEEKKSYNKTCSLVCAGSLAGKVNWKDVNLSDLLEEHKTYAGVGRLLGVSGAAVRNRAVRIGLV